jgi:hypothetical protein
MNSAVPNYLTAADDARKSNITTVKLLLKRPDKMPVVSLIRKQEC